MVVQFDPHESKSYPIEGYLDEGEAELRAKALRAAEEDSFSYHVQTLQMGSPPEPSFFTYARQYRLCREEGQIGHKEGPEEVMDMAFPNDRYREYVRTHGTPPTFRRSTCKRFGGLCSSQHTQCVALREAKNSEATP